MIAVAATNAKLLSISTPQQKLFPLGICQNITVRFVRPPADYK